MTAFHRRSTKLSCKLLYRTTSSARSDCFQVNRCRRWSVFELFRVSDCQLFVTMTVSSTYFLGGCFISRLSNFSHRQSGSIRLSILRPLSEFRKFHPVDMPLVSCFRSLFGYSSLRWYERTVTIHSVVLLLTGAPSLTFVIITSPFWTGYKAIDICTVNI